MATGDRKDPYRSYNFHLEIDGITVAGFRECSGLDSAQDPIEYRVGTDKFQTSVKLPGLNKFSNITLKSGITSDDSLWKWRENASKGKVERKPGSIVLYDDEQNEKVRWDFREAWPTKWTGPSFNATANEVAIETLEIAHEGLSKGAYK